MDGPFEPEFELLAFEFVEREEGVLRLPEEELRLRDDAAEAPRLDALPVLRLDALVLLGLLREALLFEPDPFELVDPVFRLVWERALAWAIPPP